jgi:hypothetical protein
MKGYIMVRQPNTLLIGIVQALEHLRCRRLRLLVLAAILLGASAGALGVEEGAPDRVRQVTEGASGQSQTTNVMCPVMPDMEANPDIFTDYQGKRVYFCCLSCRAAFEKNPEKYLAFLPQFSGVAAEIVPESGNQGAAVTLPQLIKPVGIAAFSCLALTVVAGLLRRKKPKLLFRWHKRLGIVTLVLAVTHLILVLIAY